MYVLGFVTRVPNRNWKLLLGGNVITVSEKIEMLGTAFCRQSAGKGEPGERGKFQGTVGGTMLKC